MKRLLFILFGGLLALSSCQNSDILPNNPDTGLEGTNVYVSLRMNQPANTRAGKIDGTANENRVDSLDFLVFSADDKFQYRRHGVMYGDNGISFRATLKVTEPNEKLTVHFLANARGLVEKLIEQGRLGAADSIAEASWEEIRKLLIDTDMRLEPDAGGLSYLPMWGTKSGLQVKENLISDWGTVNLTRSVASVNVTSNAEDFELAAAALFFVPNSGYLAPSATAYSYTDGDGMVISAESPESMKTKRRNTEFVAATTFGYTQEVNEKLYMYENDTYFGNFNATDRRYTRVVVKGAYKGTTYYYPIDFTTKDANDVLAYDSICRNTKYIFSIRTVSGPGYPDPETASKEVPVNMNVNVYEWNQADTEAGYDGTYYVSLEKKNVTLARPQDSWKELWFTTNADPKIITMNFAASSPNGTQSVVEVDTIGAGIQNNRFRVLIKTDASGNATKLHFTALQEYGSIPAGTVNNDSVTLCVGNLKIGIRIKQVDGDPTDWEDGGNQGVDLGKK